jgi:hypothetical protein
MLALPGAASIDAERGHAVKRRGINGRRAILAAVLLVCALAGTGCGPSAATGRPPILMDAIESTRLDARAVATCRAVATPLLAAIDSSAGEVRRLGSAYDLADDLELDGLADNEYVAVCAFDVSQADGLRDGLTVFTIWQKDGYGSGEFAVW